MTDNQETCQSPIYLRQYTIVADKLENQWSAMYNGSHVFADQEAIDAGHLHIDCWFNKNVRNDGIYCARILRRNLVPGWFTPGPTPNPPASPAKAKSRKKQTDTNAVSEKNLASNDNPNNDDLAGLKSQTIGGLQTQQVYHGNFLEMASQLPDQSVDIIIADPPYNASKGNALALRYGALPGMGGDWNKIAQVWDDMSLADYLSFTLNWLTEARRVLKQTGSMWVHGTYHSAGITNVAMQILDIEIINEIVWYKRNSFPNLAGRRLTASHETILWAHRGGKRAYRFNYEHSKNGDFSDDDLKAPGKQMRTVWDLPNNKPRQELAHGKHPAQKPVRLARRFIQLSAEPGDVCLVPFAGVGSECVGAQEEGLHYIGFDTDSSYVEIARARLKGGGTR